LKMEKKKYEMRGKKEKEGPLKKERAK